MINCSVRLELLMAEECRAAELAVSMDSRPIPVGADKTYLHCCLGTCFCLINTGIILARNTPWTNAFLQRVVNNSRCAPYYSERQWEQDCMQLVLQEMGELSTELVQQQAERAEQGAEERAPGALSTGAQGLGGRGVDAEGQ